MKVIKKEKKDIFNATKLNVKVKFGDVLYEIGDWLVVDSTGEAKYYTNEEFKLMFDEIPKELLLD